MRKYFPDYPEKLNPSSNDVLLLADSEDLDVDGKKKFKRLKMGRVGSLLNPTSILSFGAIGDGVTNNTNSFLDALTTADPIFVPAGNYIVNTPDTFDWTNFYGDGNIILNGVNFNLSYMQSFKYRLGNLRAKMMNGEEVNMACYGDSTIDGNNTTGWTANTTNGEGNPTGINHNPTAPNAWPAQMQNILRNMFNNSNINIWNAGYAGKEISDGWAYKNYELAVIRNENYGIQDLVFIAFGINDVDNEDYKTQLISETKKLCKKIICYGGFPVLLTNDAIIDSVLNHSQSFSFISSNIINKMKFDVSEDMGVPILDMEKEQKEWLSKNRDGYTWSDVQSDNLHFGDIGHEFKASLAAAYLYSATVVDTKRVFNFDGRSKSKYISSTSLIAGTNVRQGENIRLFNTEYTSEQILMDLWVWNNEGDMQLFYNSINSDSNDADIDFVPAITVSSPIEGAVLYDQRSPNAGFGATDFASYSDRDVYVCSLKYGLNRVTYKAPSSADHSLYYGTFSMVKNAQCGEKNYSGYNLNEYDAFSSCAKYLNTGTSGQSVKIGTESEDFSNITSFGIAGKTVTLFLDVIMGNGTGVLFQGGKGFSSGEGLLKFAGLMLFRNTSNNIELYLLKIDNSNNIIFQDIDTGTMTFNADGNKIRIEMEVSSDGENQVISVYDVWDAGSPVLTYTSNYTTTDDRLPFSGFCGGLFGNAGVANNSEIILNKCFTKYN